MSLADYPTRGSRGDYGKCKRCGTHLDGLRGVVSARLFRKADGRKPQEAIDSCASTLCDPCALVIWERVRDAIYEKQNGRAA